MGSSLKSKSTRARAARSVKSVPKPRRKPARPSPGAMAARLATRKGANIGTAAVDALRKIRDAQDGTSLADIGKELRNVVMRLERIESYIVVARKALEGGIDQADEVAVLLQRAVGDLLFKQIRTLQDVAAQCDGGPPSDRDHEDEPEEDDGGVS